MKEKELNYEEDLKINLEELHQEWLTHSGLYQKYTEEYARVMDVRDKAHERLGVVKAEVDRDVRTNPTEFGIVLKGDKPPTETAISNSVIMSKEYKEASSNLINADYEVNVMKGVVRSFEHRRDALVEEAKLWHNGYYSIPKYPDGREFNSIIEKKKEATTTNTRKSLRRKT